jgi:hypothetical protein
MRTISLVLVVASMACYREAASPPSPAAPVANKVTPRAEPRASHDVLAYLPVDSIFVVRIDFKAIRASAMWEHFRPKIDEAIGGMLAVLRERCGFDPLESVESFAFAMRSIEDRDGVAVVRGLDRDAYMACIASARDRGGAVLVENDPGIFTYTGLGGRALFAAFVDRSTAVVHTSRQASPDRLRAVLRGGTPLRRSPAFLAMFDRMAQDVALWFLVSSSAWNQTAFSGPKLRGIHGSMAVDAMATFALHIVVDDASQATQLGAALDQQLKQARPLFDKLTTTSDGDTITVECQMSVAQVERALGVWAARYRSAHTKP